MTHKVIVELLKKHAPEYVDDQVFSDNHKQVAPSSGQQVVQQSPNLVQTVQQPMPPSQQASNQYYQPTQQYQEYFPQQQPGVIIFLKIHRLTCKGLPSKSSQRRWKLLKSGCAIYIFVSISANF